jgi:uncharacterized DUF497 family protein
MPYAQRAPDWVAKMRVDEIQIPGPVEEKLWARHGVTPREVEEAFADYRGPWRTRAGADGRRRYYILGRTYAGRLLKIIFLLAVPHTAVVVSARSPSGRKDERRARRG